MTNNFAPIGWQCRRPTWNVRVHDVPGSRWIGTVDARTEEEARLIALTRFNIPSAADFDVSPR